MVRLLLIAIAMLAAIAAWIAIVFVGVNEGWGKSPLTTSNDPVDFVEAVQKKVEKEHTGNFSMQISENWKVERVYNFSIGAPVDSASVFQVASLGKWITAWGVMVLVEDGLIDLDSPVEKYLTRWQLPPSDFDNSGVTIRRLLSHTAGLDDSLGYDGFDKAADRQSLEASLTRALDASPGKSGVVEVGAEPGRGWQYSGGGYTILQLLVEEVSGRPFADFMSERIFAPLGMQHTTFRHEEALDTRLAENFDLTGQTEPFRWYTALAATSLFTSSNDLSIFIATHSQNSGQSVLSQKSLNLMRTPHASQMGVDIWGLGAMLYAPNNQGGFILGHDGSNEPAIRTAARFDPDTGDGIVILSTGSDTLATKIAGEWVFWKTRNIDSLMFLMSFNRMVTQMGVGSAAIVIFGVIVGLRSRRRDPNAELRKR